jgi:hypothetical protein
MKRASEVRNAIVERYTPDSVLEVLERLRSLAMAGDVQAAGMWLDRVIGKPVAMEPDANGDGTVIIHLQGPGGSVVAMPLLTPEQARRAIEAQSASGEASE